MIGLTYDELKALSPCDENFKAVTKRLGGAKKWDGNKISAAEAVKAGVSFDDLVWVASAVARKDKDIERRLRLWMADCAARVLYIFEKQAPADMRVRDCIISARAFARGEISAAARAAARAAAGDAAGDAARAAARDAAGDAAWDAAWAAAGDAAWAAARDAAWAAARDAAGDAAWAAAGDAAGAAEEKWQLDRLVQWLSDPEPSDLELPAPQKKSEAA